MMKKGIAFIGALFLVICSFGQNIKVPDNIQFNKVEDYNKYKDSVAIVAKWMISSPITKTTDIRTKADKFVFNWISGSPNIHVNIRPEFKDEITKDKTNIYGEDLFMDYVAGMVLIKINNNQASEFEIQEAGIKALMKGYESVQNYCTVKLVETLQKQEMKGKLTEWIKANAVKPDVK
jgi:hypothetical protein